MTESASAQLSCCSTALEEARPCHPLILDSPSILINDQDMENLSAQIGISKKELDQFYQSFSEHSSTITEGSKLDLDQFESLLTDIGQQELCKSMLEIVFSIADINCDGYISFKPFVLARSLVNAYFLLDKLSWALKIYF
jgi:Ca2+-binding EF-hand superfamily protein